MLTSTTPASRTTTLESCIAAARGLWAPQRGWEEGVNMGSSIAMELEATKIKLNN